MLQPRLEGHSIVRAELRTIIFFPLPAASAPLPPTPVSYGPPASSGVLPTFQRWPASRDETEFPFFSPITRTRYGFIHSTSTPWNSALLRNCLISRMVNLKQPSLSCPSPTTQSPINTLPPGFSIRWTSRRATSGSAIWCRDQTRVTASNCSSHSAANWPASPCTHSTRSAIWSRAAVSNAVAKPRLEMSSPTTFLRV